MSQDTAPIVVEAIGIDLGDRTSMACMLGAEGAVVERRSFPTTEASFRHQFEKLPPTRIAIEVGTHSPWVSRLLTKLGHKVTVANARKLRLIYQNPKKDDAVDAEMLARVVRMDAKLLSPVTHVRLETQQDRAVLQARDALVRARSMLVNQARGLAKAAGVRLQGCSTGAFVVVAIQGLPDSLRTALAPLLESIRHLSTEIRSYECQVDKLVEQRYPLAERLTRVNGVGNLTALAFMLAIEDPARFTKSRDVGSYLGLVPRRDQSGSSDPELGITKTGNSFVRRLLVQAAHYILGPFGKECDLRRWGLGLAARGKKKAKKRAVIATARKLAVLLHRLWVSPEPYASLRCAG